MELTDDGGGDVNANRVQPRDSSWSAHPVWSVALLLLGLAAAGLAVAARQVPGALLFGLAALALLGTAAGQLFRRPRLLLVDDSLVVATLRGRRRIGRTSVIDVQVLSLVRVLGRSRVLRIEYRDESGHEKMEILTRMDLGTDPREVARDLGRRGFTGNRAADRPADPPADPPSPMNEDPPH